MTTGPEDLDAIGELCEEDEQRLVLALLVDQQRPLTVNDLAKTIVEHEHDAPITAVDDETVIETQHALEDDCVPALEAVGLVSYDRKRQLVTPTEALEDLAADVRSLVGDEPLPEAPFES